LSPHGDVICFEEQQRNKQPFPVPAFSSRTSSLLTPLIDRTILPEVVFYKTNNLLPEEHFGA